MKGKVEKLLAGGAANREEYVLLTGERRSDIIFSVYRKEDVSFGNQAVI